jgi:hypothetical protein
MMDARTRKALEASIKHWEMNVAAGSTADVSVQESSCALCSEFIDSGCSDCPVFERSGRAFCRDTPYIQACRALARWKSYPYERREFSLAAQAELDFLRSLLPSEQ